MKNTNCCAGDAVFRKEFGNPGLNLRDVSLFCHCEPLLDRLLRETNRIRSVGLEVLRRAKGTSVLLEGTLDAVNRVMNENIYCFGPVGARHCQGPPGSPGQLAIRLLQGSPELVIIRNRGNSHYMHLL